MGAIAGTVKVGLCCLFLLSGVCKLTPKWGEDVYEKMDDAFRNRYAPFWHKILYLDALGAELHPNLIKTVFGMTEISCAVMLFTPYKIFASILLFGVMSGLVLTHVFLGEFSELPMPLLLCITSLGVCYVGGVSAIGGGNGAKRKSD